MAMNANEAQQAIAGFDAEQTCMHSYLLYIKPNWTNVHRATLIQEFFDSFQDTLLAVSGKGQVKNFLLALGAIKNRTPAAFRVPVPHATVQHLLNMALFVDDMYRIGRVPVAYDHAAAAAGAYAPGWDVFTLERGQEAFRRFQTRAEDKLKDDPTFDTFPKIPTNLTKDFGDYLIKTEIALRSILGANGVPLSYLIRPTLGNVDTLMQAEGTPGFDYIEVAIQCCPTVHSGALNDTRKLYDILYSRCETVNLAHAPANHETTKDGVAFYRSIWGHYQTNYCGPAMASIYHNRLNSLHYSRESSMSFKKFSEELQSIFTALGKAGETVVPSARFRILQTKLRTVTSLSATMAQLQARPIAEQNAEGFFLEALQLLDRAVNLTSGTTNQAYNRRASSTNTRGGRSGRGGRAGRSNSGGRNGRGNGGRGGGRGRGQRDGRRDQPYQGHRGNNVEDWFDHVGRVPGHIWRTFSAADIAKLKAAKQQLKAYVAATRAQISAASTQGTDTNTVQFQLPPLPPVPAPPAPPNYVHVSALRATDTSQVTQGSANQQAPPAQHFFQLGRSNASTGRPA